MIIPIQNFKKATSIYQTWDDNTQTAVDGFHSFNSPIYGRELDVFGCNELCV